MTRGALTLLAAILLVRSASACIWDSKTLSEEKSTHRKLADVILNEPQKVDAGELNDRIAKLKAKPKEDDVAWWNDLAGAYLRLGQSAEAVRLLEPLTNRFVKDYGIHANLGTAYHLMGRYKEAEAEIARDLAINPEAHFGLEKYHLALLQYLARDADYQLCHVYVDEFTSSFLTSHGYYVTATPHGGYTPGEKAPDLKVSLNEIRGLLESTNASDRHNAIGWLDSIASAQPPPEYETKWDLATDPKLEEGVIYMATLNRTQPACFVMLGIVANKGRNKNLAKAAFKKAIELRSPQRTVLEEHIQTLDKFHPPSHAFADVIAGLFGVLVLYIFVRISMALKSKRPKISQAARS